MKRELKVCYLADHIGNFVIIARPIPMKRELKDDERIIFEPAI